MTLKTLLIATLLAAASVSASASDYAWWLTKSYDPSDAAVEGISVENLSNKWGSIKVLTRNTFSPEELSEIYESDDFKPTWKIQRDLNGDGKLDRVIVGVASLKGDAMERFLLILTQSPNGKWSKAYLTTTETDPQNHDMGFSYLVDNGKSINWNDCFECDSGLGEIVWRGGKYIHR